MKSLCHFNNEAKGTFCKSVLCHLPSYYLVLERGSAELSLFKKEDWDILWPIYALSYLLLLHIELPHINILSKVDLIEKYGKLDFGIDFYTEVLDLEYLVDRMPDEPFTAKHKKLTKAITDLVQDYGLVNFIPLSVDSKEMMLGKFLIISIMK